jgi:RHS repeat-associated protein
LTFPNHPPPSRWNASGRGRGFLKNTASISNSPRPPESTHFHFTPKTVDTKTVHRHSLGGFATYTRTDSAVAGVLPVIKLAIILKDHLGSTDLLYTGLWNGANWGDPTTLRESFDAFGERRNASTQVTYRSTDTDAFRTGPDTYERGYTGHEQLDDSGLIHMNGRLYDPELGRMLSPDPYVQVPEYSQNFNRYSYVLNNPLNLTDPTGFNWLGKACSWLKTNWRTVVVIVVAAILVCTGIGSAIGGAMFASLYGVTGAVLTPALYMAGVTAMTGAFVGAVTGALGAALAGGNMGDVLRGAVVGGISGALTGALHGTSAVVNIAGHGVVGGASNVAMGGKFGDGFLSAAASAATAVTGLTDPETSRFNLAGRTAIASIAGGTASALGGGKFANGAVTGAMTHLLNAEASAKIKSEAVKTLSIEQSGKLKAIFAKAGFTTQLSEMYRSSLGREILAFLADNSDKWKLEVLPSDERSWADTDLHLKYGASSGVLAHESQHLAEFMTGNKNYFRNVEYSGDSTSSPRGDYSLEFRAVRIQNLFLLEAFPKCPPTRFYNEDGLKQWLKKDEYYPHTN